MTEEEDADGGDTIIHHYHTGSLLNAFAMLRGQSFTPSGVLPEY